MRRFAACMLVMALFLMSSCLAETETSILLGENITVNGAAISEDAAAAVYLSRRVETHEDVPDEYSGIENRVITITEGGTYRVSGAAEDLQLRVDAGTDDQVRIILDDAAISCRTAPGIAVISATDPRKAGEYGVTIELADGESHVSGSHTEKTEDEDVKLSGAITSLVSLGFEGSGNLFVNGDNEGIEVKNGHMTFNGGHISVTSGDDPVNASEDNVSVITMNAGSLSLAVSPEAGGEGDGMDSNGAIVINGGTLVSYAHPESMDSGIDSDLGCIINGGTVFAAGNMYDEISADSAQLFMVLQFAQKFDETIVITDANGVPVASCDAIRQNAVISSPELKEGDYYLYLGGEFSRQDGEEVYIPGKQLQHSGSFGGGFGPGGMMRPEMFEGFAFPEGMPEMPRGFEAPEDMPGMPEGFDPGRMPPNMNFGMNEAAGEASTVFHLAPSNTMFGGIQEAE